MDVLLYSERSRMMEKKLTNSGPLREPANKHSIYTLLVLLWIGAMKFTAYEAHAIHDLVASSLLRSWTYGVFGVQALSSLIGITLLAIAGLIAARPFSA